MRYIGGWFETYLIGRWFGLLGRIFFRQRDFSLERVGPIAVYWRFDAGVAMRSDPRGCALTCCRRQRGTVLKEDGLTCRRFGACGFWDGEWVPVLVVGLSACKVNLPQ